MSSVERDLQNLPDESRGPGINTSNNSQSSSHSNSSQRQHQSQNHGSANLFFADATLDLDEAHDIAETPEPPQRFVKLPPGERERVHASLRLPHLESLDGDNSSAHQRNNLSGSLGRGVTRIDSGSLQRQREALLRQHARQREFLAQSPPETPVQPTATVELATGMSPPATNIDSSNGTPSSSAMMGHNLASPITSDVNESLSTPKSKSHWTGASLNRITGNVPMDHPNRTRPRPRWPRDLPWAIAFCCIVPLSLLWPTYLWHTSSTSDMEWFTPLAIPSLRHASWISLLFSYAAALLIARLMYRTSGGGEGEDARYMASQFLLACVPVSVAIHVILIISVYLLLPRALMYALIPLWYLIRDVYLFRRWKLQGTIGVGGYAGSSIHSSSSYDRAFAGASHLPSSGSSGTPNSTRHAFFQALTCMALDILSRSLRRNSFHRCIVTLLTIQLVVAWLWRWALLGALNRGSPFLILSAIIGGKWATGTVARLLSLIASGGVARWFAENSVLADEIDANNQDGMNGDAARSAVDNDTQEGDDGQGLETAITEEYRTADASVYQSILDYDDEGVDDDDEFAENPDDDNAFNDYEYNRSSQQHQTRRSTYDGSGADLRGSTVKSFLLSGLTVSFGSVAQCGLLGGLAQFLWGQLRKIDATRTALVDRIQGNVRNGIRMNPHAVSIMMGVAGGSGGFQGMQIGDGGDRGTTIVQKILYRINMVARAFVRAHSDLAMSHVAAYYKTYRRAALDVSLLIEQAGVEPIIHDDITTHISACVGGAISGAIVILTGYALVRKLERQRDDQTTDVDVANNMLLTFLLCYTIIFTVMEPLRASIKAVYVCFAQHPRSLRQAFPLIFHRLSRMSETNLSMT